MLGLALALSACAGPPPPRVQGPPPWHPAVAILLHYATPDGILTRSRLMAGLHRDFDAADVHQKGCLDDDEVRAINQARWADDASSASPLIDFKRQGCVDFEEFAATPLSLFEQFDVDGKGVLTAKQLKPGQATDKKD